MSYSRWICSDFYTYWSSSNATRKEDELFAVHFDIKNTQTFKYEVICEMINNKELFFDVLQNEIRDESDYHELLSYMLRFKDDVENEYKEKK